MVLHFDQHVGVPQQAILACEIMVQVQKWSETEIRRVSPRAVQDSGESPCGLGKSSNNTREPGHCTSSGKVAMAGAISPGRSASVALVAQCSTPLVAVAGPPATPMGAPALAERRQPPAAATRYGRGCASTKQGRNEPKGSPSHANTGHRRRWAEGL